MHNILPKILPYICITFPTDYLYYLDTTFNKIKKTVENSATSQSIFAVSLFLSHALSPFSGRVILSLLYNQR